MKSLRFVLSVSILAFLPFYAGSTSFAQTPGDDNGSAHREAPGIVQMEKAVKDNPKDVKALLELSKAYADEEKFKEAIECSKKAAELDPTNIEALGSLAILNLQVDDKQAAENAYLSVEKLSKEDATSLKMAMTMISSVREGGEDTEMILRLKEAAKKNPNDFHPLVLIGENYMALSRNKEAMEYYDKALKMAPEEPALIYDIGMTLAFMNDFEGATKKVEELMTLKARNPICEGFAQRLKKEIETLKKDTGK